MKPALLLAMAALGPSCPSSSSAPLNPGVHVVWAWVTDDVGGRPGIVAAATDQGVLALVASEEHMARSLEPYAVLGAKSHRQTVRLVRYEARAVLEELSP